RSFPGLTHALPQHVVADRNRMLSSQALVDFIVARGTDNHIQSIICALAVVEHVSILEAEEKFLRGPGTVGSYKGKNVET
ncbi:hypothetical protein DPX16_0779, partial [Anabarilius grahami]